MVLLAGLRWSWWALRHRVLYWRAPAWVSLQLVLQPAALDRARRIASVPSRLPEAE